MIYSHHIIGALLMARMAEPKCSIGCDDYQINGGTGIGDPHFKNKHWNLIF